MDSDERIPDETLRNLADVQRPFGGDWDEGHMIRWIRRLAAALLREREMPTGSGIDMRGHRRVTTGTGAQYLVSKMFAAPNLEHGMVEADHIGGPWFPMQRIEDTPGVEGDPGSAP